VTGDNLNRRKNCSVGAFNIFQLKLDYLRRQSTLNFNTITYRTVDHDKKFNCN